MTKPGPEIPSPLTKEKKEVAYYCTGFILRKVRQRKHANPSIMDVCAAGDSSNEFSAWTTVMDCWNGLIYPSKECFNLILECDRVIMTRIKGKVTSKLLLKDVVVEEMMDDTKVKVCWIKICNLAKVMYGDALPTFELVLTAFLTMKGSALARDIKAELVRKGQVKRLSLRHTLTR